MTVKTEEWADLIPVWYPDADWFYEPGVETLEEAECMRACAFWHDCTPSDFCIMKWDQREIILVALQAIEEFKAGARPSLYEQKRFNDICDGSWGSVLFNNMTEKGLMFTYVRSQVHKAGFKWLCWNMFGTTKYEYDKYWKLVYTMARMCRYVTWDLRVVQTNMDLAQTMQFIELYRLTVDWMEFKDVPSTWACQTPRMTILRPNAHSIEDWQMHMERLVPEVNLFPYRD